MTTSDFDNIPILDFELASSDAPRYLAQLKAALTNVGFVIFRNVPGLDGAYQNGVFDLVREFYARPEAYKRSLSTDESPALRGYFRGDEMPGPNKAYAEAFRFGAERAAPPEDVPFWLKIHEGPNQWPREQDMPGFRDTMSLLFERYKDLNLKLNNQIAEVLDIDYKALSDYFPDPSEFNCVAWHYSPIDETKRQSEKNGFVNGMHEHRDPSTFVTCLIQSSQGLQVQNHAGKWIDVPMVEGGVVCNIGMQLMKLTGGALVATTHRVNTLNIKEDRFTIPYVLTTKLDKEVSPLPKFAYAAKQHVASGAVNALFKVKDPLMRSGYARISLFPGAGQRFYPEQYAEAQQLGIIK